MLGLDLSFRFDAWIDSLPASPTERGTVHACVIRPESDRRLLPEEVLAVPGQGLEGDQWTPDGDDPPGTEVSLINVHVLASLAGDDPARRALSGDNLHVDLDLSEANLPPGTVLEVGEALLRVSEVPHHPCGAFADRFGKTAAKRVARAIRRGLRGRGVLCFVQREGRIRPGDPIEVAQRPGAVD